MKTIKYNGKEYKMVSGTGSFEEKLRKEKIEYTVRTVPADFLIESMEVTSYYIKVYAYRSVKTNQKIYVAAVEWSDFEDVYSVIFQGTSEITDDMAIALERAYHNHEFDKEV